MREPNAFSEKFAYSAPLLDDKFQRVLKSIRDHSEWSDDRAIEELKSAGAEFGPGTNHRLLRIPPLKSLEKFFGKFRVQSAKSDVRAENSVTEGGNPDAEMLWEVDLAPSVSSKVKYYWLLFEPFGGKLVVLGTKYQ